MVQPLVAIDIFVQVINTEIRLPKNKKFIEVSNIKIEWLNIE